MEISKNRIKATLKGLGHCVPGLPGLARRLKLGRAPKASARYCYSVWLRHLVAARGNGLDPNWNVLMELGPGDSLGIGLAALLSGAERYVVLDWVRYTEVMHNLPLFDELVELFQRRAPIPGDEEFPRVSPKLKSYAFPDGLVEGGTDGGFLAPERIARIRQSILKPDAQDSCIAYHAPYRGEDLAESAFADLIISQAVMEHVDALAPLYQATYRWLRTGGLASHVIDYRCHETSCRWNGHWAYSDWGWALIRGNRPYLLNRAPHSEHLRWLRQCGFKIRSEIKVKMPSAIRRKELQGRFRALSEDDLTTGIALIQAQKA